MVYMGTLVFKTMADIYEVDLLVEELHRNGISIGQIDDKRFAKAFLQRGVAGDHLRVVLAILDRKVVGWTIGIRHSRIYWRRFLVLHPLWATRVLARRFWSIVEEFNLSRDLSTRLNEDAPLQSQMNADLDLQPSEIATHIDITVLDEYRRQGIASKLEEMLADELRRSGVKLIKGVIAERNCKSKSFHEKRGWRVVGKTAGYYHIIKTL